MSLILEKITDKDRLFMFAKELSEGQFTPGFDKMTADEALLWLELNWKQLCQKIGKGIYAPLPLVCFYKAKKSGGSRMLVKTTAIDTIIQKSAYEVLAEICEKQFSEHSFAYRKGKGIVNALDKYREYSEDFSYVVKTDIKDCFSNVDRDILKAELEKMLEDEKARDFVMSFVNAPVFSQGSFENNEKGLYQGAVLSNLLQNVYMHGLDKYLEEQEIAFVRYSDDIVLFAKSLNEARHILDEVTVFLRDKLGLSLRENKIKISSPFDVQYLGYYFSREKNGVVISRNKKSNSTFHSEWFEQQPVDGGGITDIISNGILKQKDVSLAFESDILNSDIPIRTVDTINVYSDVVFDSGFLKKSFENGISINVFNSSGKVIGRFIPNSPLRSPKTTHRQLMAYYDEDERLKLAKGFLQSSIHNTRLVIRYYNKQNPQDKYKASLNRINSLEKQIAEAKSYDELLMLEALVRQEYYSLFDDFIFSSEFCFDKRSSRPAKNEINAMLNFCNTVLYNIIATAIYKTPLDIRVGFLHATNSRTESLNLDIAEVFKPLIVDRTVFSLINLNSIRPEHFSVDSKGVFLNSDGKRIVLRAFYEKLRTTLKIKENNYTYEQLIKNEVQSLVRYFRSGEKYVPFKQVR